jgi:hypothetical protein
MDDGSTAIAADRRGGGAGSREGGTGRRSARSWKRGPWLVRAAAAAFAVAAIATVAFTLATAYRLHVPLPYWDEWYNIPHFRSLAAGRYGLADLASQHNEHRLLVPRLFFFADELWFHLSGLLDLTVTFVLQAANAAILILLMRRGVAPAAQRLLLSGFVLLLLFTLLQEQNFTNGFQLQFVGVFTAAALAALAYGTALERLGDGRRRASWPFFALAALASAVSAYTMANGVMTGFVLVVAALLRGAPARVPLGTLVGSLLLAALFFHGYEPGGSSLPVGEIPSHLLAYPRFVTAYLGNPLGDDLRAAQALGLVGLALAAAAAFSVATGRRRDAEGLVLLTVAGFILATAAVTAYGRVAAGSHQAFESRYATPSLIFWCAIVLFWFPALVRPGRATLGAIALGTLMLLLGLAACWSEATAWPALAARTAALRHVADSLLAGLYDAEAAGTYENTTAEEVVGFAPFLREHRLAVFAGADYAALGRPLEPLAPAGSCAGSVVARADPALGADGVRLSGTARDAATRRAPTRLFVTAAGRVVGFGSASVPGVPSRLWTGYAKARPGDALQAVAQRPDRSLCAIGEAVVAPPDPAGG